MKTLVLCNGLSPSRGLFDSCIEWADFFIAADGGANAARSFGRMPDIIIGDLDSFRAKEDDAEEHEVVYDSDQQTNDLEKALKIALEKGSSKVRVLGATGLRLDHTLKNLSVLKQFDAEFEDLVMKDDFGDTFLLPKDFERAMEIGRQVSLFPLSGTVTGISTDGLKYALDDDTLKNGEQDGSSNEVVSSPVRIRYKEGDLLIFVVR